MIIGICVLIILFSLSFLLRELLVSYTKQARKNFLSICLIDLKNRITMRGIVEELLLFISLFICGWLVGWIFYRSALFSLLLALIFQGYRLKYYQNKLAKGKEQFNDEFVELNRMLISELYSGKSLESAYMSILSNLENDDEIYYPHIYSMLTIWKERLNAGNSIEEIVISYCREVTSEVFEQFALMLKITKKYGGNMIDVIEMTNSVIRENRQVKNEISILLAEKKMEQRVLSLMPFFMMYVMQNIAYDFVSPLYETLLGRIFMTFSLITFIACYFWSNHLARINV